MFVCPIARFKFQSLTRRNKSKIKKKKKKEREREIIFQTESNLFIIYEPHDSQQVN